MDRQAYEKELGDVRKELRILGVRLSLAETWIGFLNFAYDALLHYGVNYRSLPEYANSTELDDAQKLPITKARDKIVLWLGRLQSSVSAASRRATFRVHENPGVPKK